MTAVDLLADLRRRGVKLAPNGDRLAYEAPAGVMTADVVGAIKARKPELLAILGGDWYAAALAMIEREPDPDRRAELRYRFEERAAIVEYDGGRPRTQAEQAAYLELAEMVEGTADTISGNSACN